MRRRPHVSIVHWLTPRSEIFGPVLPIVPVADFDEAIAAAKAVGDDAIARKAGEDTNPEGWTHGSSEQRQQWFRTGFESGDPSRCDTF